MKVQARNCTLCRKKIHEEEQERYLKKQYAWLTDGMHTMASLSVAVALVALMQQGRSKGYIQRFYDRMVMLYDTESVFGKKIELTTVMKQLTRDYDIDFHRIHVNFVEDEKDYIKNCKEAMKL